MTPKLHIRRAAWCALALAAPLAGCRSKNLDATVALAMARNQRKAALERPRQERDVVRDPETGQVLADRRRVTMGRKGFRNEGPQRTWYPGGGPETYREFRGGEPFGHWLSWWRTGALRSSYVFDPDRPTRMVWWHANGIVASEGMALMGQRIGPWVYRYEHGVVESEGEYVDGLKDGEWVMYDEQGEWVEKGRYLGGERVGAWRHQR